MRGVQIAAEYLGRFVVSAGGKRVRLDRLPVGLVGVLIACNLGWNLPPQLAAQQGKYNITPTPLQVVERANVPKPALVFVKNVESWSDFAAPFAANSPTLDGPLVYASDEGPEIQPASARSICGSNMLGIGRG